MQVFARLRLPGGQLVDAAPGDLIGRLPTAAVRLNDPRISEAHALVSLRSRTLRLLALRGRFAVAGAIESDIALSQGQVIQLAPGIELAVMAISMQEGVFGIEGPNVPRQVLPPVASFIDGQLVPSFQPEAAALLWTAGQTLTLRVPGRADACVEPGDTFTIGAATYRIVSVALESANTPATERGHDLDAPLTLVLRYDTVHIQRGTLTTAIDGQPARLVTELGLMGVPAEWRTMAALLWPGESEEVALRSRWDRVLARLRQRLREANLRPDLVRTDGAGRVELFLGPRDRVKDET